LCGPEIGRMKGRIWSASRARRDVTARRTALLICALTFVAAIPGCFFARVSARNAAIVLRTPDEVPNRIIDPRRPDARLAALWVGHATVLVQIDDKFVLTDPVFTGFVGTLSRRLVEPGIAPENLPLLDAAVVSHRHYDHLSPESIRRIGGRVRVVLVPEATSADIPPGPYRTLELPWWRAWESDDGLRITAVPVKHEGGRAIDASSHPRSYTGYVIEYHGVTVYFPGDTAYAPDLFSLVAARFPTIDLALLPIGPIAPRNEMQPRHMNPEQALRAAFDLHARRMIPIHYDTFIDSDDDTGDCLRGLEHAISDLGTRNTLVLPLRIGEHRILETREGVSTNPTSSPPAPTTARRKPRCIPRLRCRPGEPPMLSDEQIRLLERHSEDSSNRDHPGHHEVNRGDDHRQLDLGRRRANRSVLTVAGMRGDSLLRSPCSRSHPYSAAGADPGACRAQVASTTVPTRVDSESRLRRSYPRLRKLLRRRHHDHVH
jgi:N-acyl-phosphatidylethanolamine-hydrolysing phospholipase D